MWLLTTHRTRAQRAVSLQAFVGHLAAMCYAIYALLQAVLHRATAAPRLGVAYKSTSFWLFGIRSARAAHTMVNAR